MGNHSLAEAWQTVQCPEPRCERTQPNDESGKLITGQIQRVYHCQALGLDLVLKVTRSHSSNKIQLIM